jgi:eukaryotic-like serine/threonine-protein kinase
MVDSGSNPDDVAKGADSDRSSSSDDLTLWKEGSETARAESDARIGTLIAGRYRIEGLLGEGGMGRVYKAVHINMHKDVALKVLRPEMMVVPGVLARFEREAVAAGRISHPNVVAATDFGRIDGDSAFYLVLEFVDGRNLRQELKHGPFTVSRALGIALQMSEALVAAHQRGVIHRDLKPDNIMLVDNHGSDFVKVLDFGIAKLNDPVVGGEGHQTRMGLVMGTPRYMSPEQGAGAPVDHRTDLYSLGVILYEMLAGQPPFGGAGVDAVLVQHLATSPPALPAHVESAVSELVFHLLAKDAKARPASATEVVHRLRRLQRATAFPRQYGPSLLPGMFFRGIKRVAIEARARRAWGSARWQRVWTRLTLRAPWLRQFEGSLRLGPISAPVPVLVAALASVVLAFFWFTGDDATKATSTAVDAPIVIHGTASPDVAQVNAELSTREELDDLLAIPVYKRDRQQWLDIAAGHAGFQEWKQSVAAYRNALQLEPKLKGDPKLLRKLREMAELFEVYDAVATIALNLLGEAGMDLMYDVWLSTRGDESKAVIAANAQKNLSIFRLRAASRALRVPLALQFAKPDDCGEIDKALSDALEYADERAVPFLIKLRETTGCGVSKKRDCYSCIRPRAKELEAAITRAAARPAPRWW